MFIFMKLKLTIQIFFYTKAPNYLYYYNYLEILKNNTRPIIIEKV